MSIVLLIETHVFDMTRDLYGSSLRLVLRPAAARRARVSRCRCAARADRRRLPERAAAVRPHFAVESQHVSIAGPCAGSNAAAAVGARGRRPARSSRSTSPSAWPSTCAIARPTVRRWPRRVEGVASQVAPAATDARNHLRFPRVERRASDRGALRQPIVRGPLPAACLTVRS